MNKGIIAILSRMQKDLKANKGQFNSFGKYHYRSLEDLTEAIKRILPAEVAFVMTDELVMVGNRYYIKATAKLTNGEESVESVGYARESENKKGMDDSQITGATSSYARKYACNALFAVDDCKDADTLPPPEDKPPGSRESNPAQPPVKKQDAPKPKSEAKEGDHKKGTVTKKWEDTEGNLWINFKTERGQADVKCDPESFDEAKEGGTMYIAVEKNDKGQLYITDRLPF